jgi:NAD+ kinase
MPIFVHQSFAAYLPTATTDFETYTQLPDDIHCLMSLGGDGTLLDSVRLAGCSGTPVLGINTGRLGFLSSVPLSDADKAVDALLNNNYRLEERTLLEVSGDFLPAGDSPYALNDIGIQRHHPSMIAIRVTINQEALPDYWADGLLLATPTGSTAYSMSAGGPIVAPDSQSIIITPIASHNLNIRPLVIADNAEVGVQVFTRKGAAVISLDNRIYDVPSGTEIQVRKANFTAKIIKLHRSSFFSALHEKLSWGIDKRNIAPLNFLLNSSSNNNVKSN